MSAAVSSAFRKSWVLVREQSKFVDWQKVKVQEKSDEVPVAKHCSAVQHRAKQCNCQGSVPLRCICCYLLSTMQVPAGSLPRTMEVILRNDVVEHARAGDETNFTGTLLVVPDVAAISAPGDKVQTKPGLCPLCLHSTSQARSLKPGFMCSPVALQVRAVSKGKAFAALRCLGAVISPID